MAFKMNRPVIKGTANHKASIAKATSESIVSQRRTQADTSLVGAGKAIGESYIPAAIDYGIEQKGVKFLDIKKEGGKGKDKGKTKKGSNEIKVGSTADTYTGGFGEDNSDIKAPDVDYKKPKSDIRVMTPKELKNKDKKKKVKKEKKPKVKKEKGDNIFEKGYKSIRDKIRAKREQKELDFQAKQEEKNRIQAEKTKASRIKKENEAAAKAEADRIAEQKRLATLKAQEDRFKNNKLDITSEVDESERLLQSIDEKKGEDIKTKPKPKEIVRSNIITEEDIAIANEKAKKAAAFDPEDARVYTKEEQGRLKFDEKTNEMRLPEEIAADKTTYTEEPVVEEKKTTTSNARQRRLDKKWENAGPNVRANMEADGYVPPESKSAALMRDNRIYRNAIKGGAVRRNMIKSGYKPE
jgi:hypothetical protein